MQQVRLPRLAPWAPQLLRSLFSSSLECWTEEDAGSTLRLGMPRNDMRPDQLYDFSWNGEKGWLGITSGSLVGRHPVLSGLELKEIPDQDRGLIMEAALEELFEKMEQGSSMPCALGKATEDHPEALSVDTVAVGFEFKPTNLPAIKGIMWLGPLGLKGLCSLTGPGQASESRCRAKDILFDLFFNFAAMELESRQLKELESGDILLPGISALDEVTIFIGTIPLFKGRIQDSFKILITGKAKEKMEEKEIQMGQQHDNHGDSEDQREPLLDDPGQLPVEIRFHLGTTTMTLSELEKISPGYVFETTAPASTPVAIMANGARIGTGELVEVGGKLGIRVVEIVGNGTN